MAIRRLARSTSLGYKLSTSADILFGAARTATPSASSSSEDEEATADPTPNSKLENGTVPFAAATATARAIGLYNIILYNIFKYNLMRYDIIQ